MRQLTVKSNVHFGTGRRSKKELRTGVAQAAPLAPKGPRVARLMALAIKFEQMVRDGDVKDYAEIARLGHVTRARLSQIMNLVNLAPDIQEQLLFLSAADAGKDRVTERCIRAVIKYSSWRQQQAAWSRIALA